MTLADRYNAEGLFAGLHFYATSHRRQGGRRIVSTQYPGSDRVDREDMGRSDKPLSLDLFLFGDNFDEQRKAMEEALDSLGPHRLEHPWKGLMDVHVADWTLTETDEEGGLARFSCEFLRVDVAVAAPSTVGDWSGFEAKADAALPQIAVEAQRAWSGLPQSPTAPGTKPVPPLPVWVAEVPQAAAVTFFDQVDELVSKARKIPDPARALAARIIAAKAAVATLIRVPYNLAAEITGIVNDCSTGLAEPVDALGLYRFLSSFGLALPSFLSETPSEKAARANVAAIENMVRQAAALAGARVSASIEYSSQAEALAALDEWEQRLDVSPLQDARAAYVDAMRALAARLPEVSSITLPWPVPAVVVANRLYGPANVAARAADIARRNRVSNPLWVGGALPVEVLGV